MTSQTEAPYNSRCGDSKAYEESNKLLIMKKVLYTYMFAKKKIQERRQKNFCLGDVLWTHCAVVDKGK